MLQRPGLVSVDTRGEETILRAAPVGRCDLSVNSVAGGGQGPGAGPGGPGAVGGPGPGPVDNTFQIKMLYMFMDIKLDSLHFI